MFNLIKYEYCDTLEQYCRVEAIHLNRVSSQEVPLFPYDCNLNGAVSGTDFRSVCNAFPHVDFLLQL